MTIIVDGNSYNVTAKKITRKAVFLDKYAERTEDGVLHRELIGVYYNYSMEINYTADADSYDAFWSKLVEAVEFHTITVPNSGGNITFTAYLDASGVVDDIFITTDDNKHHWQNLTINFIAKSPYATP
jgi:hypothetical protein